MFKFAKQLMNSFTSDFSSYTEVRSAHDIEVNPLMKTLEDMNSKPHYKSIDGFDYLKFGKNDDADLMIEKLASKSAMNSGIISKKAKMISGKGLIVNSELKGTKDANLRFVLRHAGGSGISLYRVVTKLAFEYVKSGAVGLIVDFSKTDRGKSAPNSFVKLTVVPQRMMRFEKMSDGSMNFENIIYRQTFKLGSNVPKAERIPIFNPFSKEKRQMLYIKNPYSMVDSYGVPIWVSATNFIEADFEFGREIENSAKNGFAPKTMITLIGRNMSDTKKALATQKIDDGLSGSTGKRHITTFIGRPEEKPQIDALQGASLDKTIEVMSSLNDSKILTAHNITSPSLFGIMLAGKMGGTGTELLSAFKLFKATETIPDRNIILDAVTDVFNMTQMTDIEIDIEEEDVDVNYKTQPTEGGNTDKNPNVKKDANANAGNKKQNTIYKR